MNANLKGVGLILGVIFLLVMLGQFLGARNTASAIEGTPAPARVERAASGSCIIGFKSSSCFELTLSVHPPQQAAFTTKLDVNIPNQWTSRVQPASWVMVVVDREDPSKVGLDLDAFELPPPTPPPESASAASAAP
ncbi:hypothetical protein A176_004987 [Myxococcus hansupus]|uniref:Uncharacterized protein n=1 Tax=Pseudomyxococcus hansupus TaxID=1297742 RepID=A0A0H4X356_9BACT|nr:hypothetical protein [Myxococcus hansupus]AKQ68075.1 hypothetical protein A176_004987 [Myxococcus hansupus]